MEGWSSRDRATQGRGGVPIPGSAHDTTGHGTQCSGLDKLVISHRLDSVILEFLNFLEFFEFFCLNSKGP